MKHHIKINPHSDLDGVKVGPGFPVRIMGVINASPESFYGGSVRSTEKAAQALAHQMQKEGADFIDVGAMSSAPYLKTEISEIEEARRLSAAIKGIRRGCSLPISVDTFRLRPAFEGFVAGATILNDITGLAATPELALLAKKSRGLILMAHPRGASSKLKNPVADVKKLLTKSLSTALKAGVPRSRIVLDPGIGFFRNSKIPWWKWDLTVLRGMKEFLGLGVPLLAGVSRKSFIGHLLGGVPADQRLEGSLAATVVAVLNGASIIRTHDVRATREAVRIAENFR